MSNQVCVEQPVASQQVIDDGQQARAGSYAVLAALLAYPPGQAFLTQLQSIEIDEDESRDVVNAWNMLRLAAQMHSAESITDEYYSLFIGIGRGELVPFASWYLTGFLMEKPLAHLRQRLSDLGFERQDDVKEPEDHVAALCEVMSQLIIDETIDFETEKQFFEEFMGNWMTNFFHDLQHARSPVFYKAVGQLGEAIMEIEKRYFSMMT